MPGGNELVGILHRMGMKFASMFNGTSVVYTICLNWLRVRSVQQVPPTRREMVWNVTAFLLLFLHRSACCHWGCVVPVVSWQRSGGEGKSGRPGAWQATLQLMAFS
eukprot:1141066-Pelagomonas_calceolata.AAC.1